ncbi:hypothetical protein GL263_17480 [Streptomyces durbertensis]|uniref:PH domain-containing protein n=1 Tax=Streptomyces durbertensis TaxID=2448886 RepID=A0ABR6EJ28_9ACTN|nr:hypothetical protein [Streptomyces durbertensis]MBB1245346.1 hypothetical protein [Streptomyces durbertensis]
MDPDETQPSESQRPPVDAGSTEEPVHFLEHWRDVTGRLAAAAAIGTLGSLLLFALWRNADRVDDLYMLFLWALLYLAAGAMLTIGFLPPLMTRWTVLVDCSPQGVSHGGVTHPWATVRSLRLGAERGRRTSTRYQLEVRLDERTVRVRSVRWRDRAHELAEAVQRFAPGTPVELDPDSVFGPGGDPRAGRTSRAATAALVAATVLLWVLVCAAVLRWAPGLVTLS